MKSIAKFFKKLFKITLWFILIVLLLVVILYLCAGKIVQYVAPEFISKVTQTETTLGEVDISLFSGRLSLNNLTIDNPSGFKDKDAFKLGSINITFNPKSVLSDKIIVDKVAISGVNVSTELNAKGKTNVSELLNNVNKFVGADTPKAPQKQAQTKQASTPQKASSKSVVIRDLTIDKSSVRAGIAGQMVEIPLPAIHQKNIGESKKQSLTETLVGILNSINIESTKAVVNATKEMLSKNIQAGKDSLNNLTNTIKNLF